MLIEAAQILTMAEPAYVRAIRIADGRIVALGDDLTPLPGETHWRCPDQIVLPGLVNAHCHLDLSITDGPLPHTGNFVDWLTQIIPLRQRLTITDLERGLRFATRQLLTGGTTTVGDYVGDLRLLPLLAKSPLQGHIFVELIGKFREEIRQRRVALAEQLRATPLPPRWTVSATPHAPYSIGTDALRASFDAHRLVPADPLAMHCAESREEWEFFTRGTGPLAAATAAWGFPYAPPAESPLHYLAGHGGLPESSLFIHANYLHAGDIARLHSARATVVHCPQCHAYFGHEPFPLDMLRRAQIPVALGTDGLVSCPALNLLTELALMREKHPALPAREILAMATVHGARALGRLDRCGTLEVGKQADLIAVSAGDARQAPEEQVLQSRAVSWSLIVGNEVYRAE